MSDFHQISLLGCMYRFDQSFGISINCCEE